MKTSRQKALAIGLSLIAVVLGVFGAAAADAPLATRVNSRVPWLNGLPDDIGPNYKSWRIASDPAPSDHSNARGRVQSACAAPSPKERGVVETATRNKGGRRRTGL